MVIIAFLLAAGTGCFSMMPEDVTGRYGQAGHIGFLVLYTNGEYECFVVNGMTADGCGTFEGAGVSKGLWVLDNGTVTFVPLSEPSDLVVKLSQASATLSGAGLLLTIEGTDYLLPKQSMESLTGNIARENHEN